MKAVGGAGAPRAEIGDFHDQDAGRAKGRGEVKQYGDRVGKVFKDVEEGDDVEVARGQGVVLQESRLHGKLQVFTAIGGVAEIGFNTRGNHPRGTEYVNEFAGATADVQKAKAGSQELAEEGDPADSEPSVAEDTVGLRFIGSLIFKAIPGAVEVGELPGLWKGVDSAKAAAFAEHRGEGRTVARPPAQDNGAGSGAQRTGSIDGIHGDSSV